MFTGGKGVVPRTPEFYMTVSFLRDGVKEEHHRRSHTTLEQEELSRDPRNMDTRE